MALYDQQSPQVPAPTRTPAKPAMAQDTDPFAAMGGGVQLPGGGWVPKTHALAQTAGATTPTVAPTAPTSASSALQGTATAGATIAPGTPTTAAQAFQQALVNRLTAGPVSAQSPEISGVIAANRGAEQRGFERNRALAAERAAATGLDPNAISSQLMGLASERAGRESQFAGNATMQLAQQRAQELTSALALGGSMLSEQDRLALQQELANLQAQISREGMALQGQLGTGDLSLRRELGSGQLNLGLLNALLGNQQFGQNLGAQLGMFNANLNQSALANLLGGL